MNKYVAFILLCFCVVQFQVKCCNPKNCETGKKMQGADEQVCSIYTFMLLFGPVSS